MTPNYYREFQILFRYEEANDGIGMYILVLSSLSWYSFVRHFHVADAGRAARSKAAMASNSSVGSPWRKPAHFSHHRSSNKSILHSIASALTPDITIGA